MDQSQEAKHCCLGSTSVCPSLFRVLLQLLAVEAFDMYFEQLAWRLVETLNDMYMEELV